MLTEKTVKEFQDSGLLWFINTILHTFGWVIVAEGTNMYPCRTDMRGFSNASNDKGYKRITEYLANNINTLMKDVKDLEK